MKYYFDSPGVNWTIFNVSPMLGDIDDQLDHKMSRTSVQIRKTCGMSEYRKFANWKIYENIVPISYQKRNDKEHHYVCTGSGLSANKRMDLIRR